MAAVVQWLERQIVVLNVAGSNPVSRPIFQMSERRIVMENTNFSKGEKIQFGGCDWRVLDVQNNKVLILSDVILGKQFYHNKHDFVTWADCDLRKLLNEKFYDFFSPAEKARIVDTTVETIDNPRFGTSGGVATVDKIFLLSIDEAVLYFGDSGQMQNGCSKGIRPFDECISDQYNEVRIAQDYYDAGIYMWWRDGGFNSAWWLRSPGGHGTCTAFVDYNGEIRLFGDSSIPEYRPSDDGQNVQLGIRPALWLSVE